MHHGQETVLISAAMEGMQNRLSEKGFGKTTYTAPLLRKIRDQIFYPYPEKYALGVC
jgi:hypothetical protein